MPSLLKDILVIIFLNIFYYTQQYYIIQSSARCFGQFLPKYLLGYFSIIILYKHKKQQAVLLYDHLPVICSDIIFCISSIHQTRIYRFVPSSLKLFFNDFSVGKIEPIKNTSCITMIIMLNIPIVSSLAP